MNYSFVRKRLLEVQDRERPFLMTSVRNSTP